MRAKYDIIGINYAELRKPDRRIARIIERALGSAQTVDVILSEWQHAVA